jgi:CBS domain-containing protein
LEPIERLKDIKKKLVDESTSDEVLVRNFLQWFDAKRRGVWVVSHIRKALESVGLKTEPDFESAYIDSSISFKLKNTDDDSNDTKQTEKEFVGGYDSDPTYRISKLAAANTKPKTVTPQQTLTEAITLMLANDFSQLPVVIGERDVKGIISWRTIGARLVLNRNGNGLMVKDFMEPVKIVTIDSSIFSVIQDIVQSDCVLVKDNKDIITGIITTSDLSEQFGILSRPFLILGEIENYIRKMLDNRFTKEQLLESIDPSDSGREIESISDLTFGEYLRLIENPGRWEIINLNVDRKLFTSDLDAIRKIRNSVMHFDPDGVDSDDMSKLNQFCEFLRSLERCGALEN